MKYQQGADTTCVGDVVVGICVYADVISIPRDSSCRVSFHCTAHITLIAYCWSLRLQRYNERWSTSQITVLFGWFGYHHFFCRRLQIVSVFFLKLIDLNQKV